MGGGAFEISVINKTNEKDADPGVCDSLNKVGTHGQVFPPGWAGGARRLWGQGRRPRTLQPHPGGFLGGVSLRPSRAHELSVPG